MNVTLNPSTGYGQDVLKYQSFHIISLINYPANSMGNGGGGGVKDDLAKVTKVLSDEEAKMQNY